MKRKLGLLTFNSLLLNFYKIFKFRTIKYKIERSYSIKAYLNTSVFNDASLIDRFFAMISSII
jgi:hypothetical protein